MVLKFMDNKKDDKYYFAKIIEDIGVIKKYLGDASYEQFLADEVMKDATMFRLVQLIENIKSISETFRNEHQEIPWAKIVGFRNKMVHEYGKTDYAVVYQIFKKDLCVLENLFEQYL